MMQAEYTIKGKRHVGKSTGWQARKKAQGKT